MVDLVRLDVAQRPPDVLRILELDLREPEPLSERREALVLLRIPEHRAEHLIALPEQQLREVGTVLPADAGHERAARHPRQP